MTTDVGHRSALARGLQLLAPLVLVLAIPGILFRPDVPDRTLVVLISAFLTAVATFAAVETGLRTHAWVYRMAVGTLALGSLRQADLAWGWLATPIRDVVDIAYPLLLVVIVVLAVAGIPGLRALRSGPTHAGHDDV